MTVKVDKPIGAREIIDVANLSEPVEIEEDVQDAIYLVDFAGEDGDNLVTIKSDVRLATDLTAIDVPFAINANAQGAIYSVDFLGENAGDFLTLTVDGPVMGDDIVTMSNLTRSNVFANYGNIDAFWGNINPFYGNIGAFWGDINAFANTNTLSSLGNFWQGQASRITSVENAFKNGSPDQIQSSFRNLIAPAESTFGTKYNQATGKHFLTLVDEIFARHGANPNDKASLAALTEAQRARLYLDWHDSMNLYSGVDAVDHWMRTVNWTPSLTQIQGTGTKTLIGIIDSNFRTGDLNSNVVSTIYFSDGNQSTVNSHGAGVASLIASKHDGKGVMGIAPNSNIWAFNPFDANGQTTWARLGTVLNFAGSYQHLNSTLGTNQKISVLNLSLGERGWVASQGLATLLASDNVKNNLANTVFVIAAGNEGIAQTANVEWGFTTREFSPVAPTMDPVMAKLLGYPVVSETTSNSTPILVGSVRADGTISDFSNRPGSACLLNNGVCRPGQQLMNYFIVAPGELLLVSDGAGGVTRASGTSFAAPLVSGTIALLHDRWPWLQNHAKATADIIFKSARDLGAPGVDAVYGHGLLDVAASQSPLNFGQLSFTFYQTRKSGRLNSFQVTVADLLANGLPSWWETDQVFLTAFETVGGTFRDFAIPMSSMRRGGSTDVLGNGAQRMQDFVSDRFARWILSGGADRNGDGRAGISQIASNEAETRDQWTVRYDALAPRYGQEGSVQSVHNAATLTTPDGKASFTLGHGQGAMALADGQFGIMSDHDTATGGVNPILGFASGEMFAGASYKITPDTTVSVGFSAEREDWKDLNTDNELDRQIQRQLGAREAGALTFSVDQKITDKLSFGVQYTHLDEADAVLGAQTGSDLLLGEGSRTDAMTVSANFNAGRGLSFDLSLTGGATATNSGQLEFNSEQVIDRQTGERGMVTQFIGIDTKRRFTSEFVYATPVTDNSEFGLIGRYVSAGEIGQDESVMIGANFGLRF